jgi:hypothetical protein
MLALKPKVLLCTAVSSLAMTRTTFVCTTAMQYSVVVTLEAENPDVIGSPFQSLR